MKNVKIPWDLERTSLQIKTNSKAGSGEIIKVTMHDNGYIGDVRIKLSHPMKYLIAWCTQGYTTLPVQPPEEVDKIWTITKTDTAIIITCNNVEVLNFQFAIADNSLSMSSCVTKLGGDVVEDILFHSSSDTASDFYRAKAGKCLNLIDTTYVIYRIGV